MSPERIAIRIRSGWLTPILRLIACALFAAPNWAGSQSNSDAGNSEVNIDRGLKIPMADGTPLNGTLYRPAVGDPGAGARGTEKRFPTIVTITPYSGKRFDPDARYFTRNNFAFLTVDARGRGDSGGSFVPFSPGDGLDGRDVVEWITKQPWSDGRVLMRGGSYAGYNQWSTVRHQPKGLASIVPIASAFPGIDFPMNYNVPVPYSLRWLSLTSGITPRGKGFGDKGFWNRVFRGYHTSGAAFDTLDKRAGMPNAHFQEWMAHPVFDGYWAERAPTPEQYARLDLPILTITGYYDADQPGAMAYYHRHMRHGSESGKARHFLVLGPWNHGGTRKPVQTFGGVKFGNAMMFDALGLDREWYRWVLGEGPRPAFLLDRVTYFVAGANRWRSAPSLEAIADQHLVLHLQSAKSAGSLDRAGKLVTEPPDAADVDHYVYDPLDYRKVMLTPSRDYLTDASEVLATDGDGLIYQSEPLAKAMEITGYLRLDTWLETDVPDTDINATLYEILADGTSIALTGQTLRLRYRHSLESETLMTPGVAEPVVFDRFYFISRQVAKGSRLRLFIRPSNGLANQRNYNSGGVVARETREDARTATVKLHLGPGTPTRLTLPVVTRLH